jgi:hypothetical protein
LRSRSQVSHMPVPFFKNDLNKKLLLLYQPGRCIAQKYQEERTWYFPPPIADKMIFDMLIK